MTEREDEHELDQREGEGAEAELDEGVENDDQVAEREDGREHEEHEEEHPEDASEGDGDD